MTGGQRGLIRGTACRFSFWIFFGGVQNTLLESRGRDSVKCVADNVTLQDSFFLVCVFCERRGEFWFCVVLGFLVLYEGGLVLGG